MSGISKLPLPIGERGGERGSASGDLIASAPLPASLRSATLSPMGRGRL